MVLPPTTLFELHNFCFFILHVEDSVEHNSHLMQMGVVWAIGGGLIAWMLGQIHLSGAKKVGWDVGFSQLPPYV